MRRPRRRRAWAGRLVVAVAARRAVDAATVRVVPSNERRSGVVAGAAWQPSTFRSAAGICQSARARRRRLGGIEWGDRVVCVCPGTDRVSVLSGAGAPTETGENGSFLWFSNLADPPILGGVWLFRFNSIFFYYKNPHFWQHFIY